jgi:hypothetical protein
LRAAEEAVRVLVLHELGDAAVLERLVVFLRHRLDQGRHHPRAERRGRAGLSAHHERDCLVERRADAGRDLGIARRRHLELDALAGLLQRGAQTVGARRVHPPHGAQQAIAELLHGMGGVQGRRSCLSQPVQLLAHEEMAARLLRVRGKAHVVRRLRRRDRRHREDADDERGDAKRESAHASVILGPLTLLLGCT